MVLQVALGLLTGAQGGLYVTDLLVGLGALRANVSIEHKEQTAMRLDLFRTRAVMKCCYSQIFQVMQHGPVGNE